jgi:hypothetical protein
MVSNGISLIKSSNTFTNGDQHVRQHQYCGGYIQPVASACQVRVHDVHIRVRAQETPHTPVTAPELLSSAGGRWLALTILMSDSNRDESLLLTVFNRISKLG